MKTAVIYARYSSDSQTEQSIEGQLRVCKEFAERSGIVVINEYIDRAKTGTNDNRPAFQQMISDSKNKNFTFVLVYKLDRFSRNRYDSAINTMELSKNGVRVISATENISDKPEGKLLENVIIGINEYYSAELSQKVKRGLNESRIKGNFTGGRLIYGYKLENHKVLVDEEQAEVVRFIYEQYAIGTYVKDIIAKLTSKHILNKGKPFATNTIYNILKNEKYSGVYRFKNEVFDNMFPAIVPNEIYQQVRNKIDSNRYGKRSTEIDYLLRQKLICGNCGMPINAECGTARNGTKRYYYKCLGRKRNKGCTKASIKKEILENVVIQEIIKILNSPKFKNFIVDNLLKAQEEQSSCNNTLSLLTKEKQQNEKALNNIMIAIEQGIMNNTTNKRMKELESTIEELERKILVEKSKTIFKLTRQDVLEFYEQALKLEPKLLINYLIKHIIVFDDKLEITFNSPLKTSPDNVQGFLICKKFNKLLIEIYV